VTALAHPVIPEATAKIWAQMGLGDIRKFPLSDLQWGQLKLGTKLGDVQPVFPRADKSAIERMQQMEEQGRSAAAVVEENLVEKKTGEKSEKKTDAPASSASTPVPKPAAVLPDGKISIEDFAKVELRVGQVKVAEKVKGADKLLRLEVDLGTEIRQVVAGIAEAYAPETLIGRKVVIVVNLAPRKLRGLESNGMIVAASPEGGKPILASFLEDVPIGTRLK
jgi:methionyl-tRNA synthetase